MTILPGSLTLLVYGGFALLALGMAHRWLRPISKTSWMMLIALPWVLTGPSLISGEVFGPVDLAYMGQPLYSLKADHGVEGEFSPLGGDVAFQMIPWRKAVRHEIKHGRWPLWNPFMLAGDILAASAIPAPYHPVHLLSFLLPLGTSLVFVAAAVLFSAGLCAFLFMRDLGCREEAAMIGAAAWMFSGFMIFWLQWPHTLTVAAFPWVLLGARRVIREPSRSSIVVLATAFTWVLLAGHPESAFHVVAVGALYGAAEWIAHRGRPMLTSLLAALLAAAIAIAVSAVYLLPFIEAMPQSREYQLRRALYADSDRSVAPGEALMRARVNLLPSVYGLPWQEEAANDDPFFVPLSSAYVGSCLLPWIFLGLVWHRGWRRWWWLGLALGGISLGASAPGLSDLLARLPLFDLSINKRLVFVGGFALACLAALGAEAWCAQGTRRRGRGGARVAVLLLALLWGSQWPGMAASGLSRDFIIDQGLLTLLPAIAALLLIRQRRLSRRGILLALLVLLATQRWFEVYDRHPTFPQEAFFPPVPILEKVRQEPGVFRVVGTGTALLPNISALYELEDVRGYQGMYFDRFTWTYPLWTEVHPSHHYHRVDAAHRPFLSFLNVRFAIVPKGDPAPLGWAPWLKGRGAVIYENPAVVDRVFLPQRVWLDVPAGAVAPAMASTQDFSQTAWIETGDAASVERPGPMANGRGTLQFTRQPYGYAIDADMQEAGWVVVSETGWKGWRAFKGDEEIELAFANRAFLAFQLPSGRHRVDLVYRPKSFLWGRAISFATLLLVGGWLVGFKGLPRRAAKPSSPTF